MTDDERLARVRHQLISAGLEDTPPAAAVTVDGLAVYGARVVAEHAAQLWRRLRDHHADSGLWPFLSDRSPAGWVQWCRDFPGGPARLTAAAARPPSEVVDELIAAQRAGSLENDAGEDDAAYALGLFDVDHTRELMQREPPGQPGREYSEIGGPAGDPGWLCLVPAAAGYELPALLHAPHATDWYGSRAHSRLTQQDHVGVLRSWHERFGAEVRYLNPVTLGLVVERPPTEPSEVARVAVEQFAYCDDLGQFLGETHVVAQRQVPLDRWHFWWD